MRASAAGWGEIGAGPWAVFGWGVMAAIFIFGLDMPKPGPILSDQCLMFANLFMLAVVGGGRGEKGSSKRVVVCSSGLCLSSLLRAIVIGMLEAHPTKIDSLKSPLSGYAQPCQ
jgi:hypothetical protein